MRASKRRKVSGAAFGNDSSEEDNGHPDGDAARDPFENMQWECIAITLSDYQQFLASIQKTKDADEKILRDRIVDEVMPVIEKEEESHQREKIKREKELLNLQMLAGAKRSSRIAGKAEKERHDRELEEATRKKEADAVAARKAEEKKVKMEEERRSRMQTREERIKEREKKRLLHETELQRIKEEQEKLERGESRVSERQLRAELERQRKNLEGLSQDDEWIFDCSGCGVHGENLVSSRAEWEWDFTDIDQDDGSHSVACEKCSVWQHSKCLGIGQDEAEREDFHFVCLDCKRRVEEAKMPKLPPLKFRVGSSPSAADAEKSQPKPVAHTFVQYQPQVHQSPSKASNVSPSKPPAMQPSLQPQHATRPVPFPLSPERRPQSAHMPSFGSPRAPFSPTKGANGYTPSGEQPPKFPPIQQAAHLPPNHHRSPNGGSLTQRPSSSHSVHSQSMASPIQNRPSMSPTQGNRDVGPLAGIPPPPASSESPAPWTPFRQQHVSRPGSGNYASFSSAHNGHSSLMATPGSHSSPPQSSHGMPFSGISPTKQSPRPMTSGSMAGAPVLPPIQKLEPSPKLMGRSSPDAPIPPPVKCMTPEQEERRQRENAVMFHNQPAASNGQHSAMSSPSLNRIPPLGPSAMGPRPDSQRDATNGQS